MLRISSILNDAREHGSIALMPFITAGFPSLDVTMQVIPTLEQAGADVIEIGIPFSDPIADGPVIASSMHAALQAGVAPQQVFDAMKRVRSKVGCGLVGMVSDSIVTRIGPEQFINDAADAGFDGLIVPDLDLDAAAPLLGLARMRSIALAMLIAPTTTPARIQQIVTRSTGFVYLLARVGITGERSELELEPLRQRIAMVRSATSLPIAVGFGISLPEHVAALRGVADGAIIGSALVRCMAEAPDAVAAATTFLAPFAAVAGGQGRATAPAARN